ncbi:hypothetical protein ACTXT7_008639 [Hymenolepis weldensis]
MYRIPDFGAIIKPKVSDRGSAVLYKHSNVERYGVIEEVDNEQNRYLVVPFGSDSKLWVSKEDAVCIEYEEINNVFIKLSLDSAINLPEKIEKEITTCNVDDESKADEKILPPRDVVVNHMQIPDLQATATELSSEGPHWEVDQVCVCRWCYDNEWYFAVITAIFPEDRTINVRFLYYENSQMFVPISRIHPVNSTTIEWVKDDYNADAAYRILGVFLTVLFLILFVSDVAIAFVILLYKDHIYYASLENLFLFDSLKAKLNFNEETITATEIEIERIWPTRQPTEEESEERVMQTLTSFEEKKEATPKKNKERKRNLLCGPEGMLNIPEISCFWLSLVEKKYGSETSAIRRLILSQYQLGYDAGFKMGLKTRGVLQE